MERKVVSSSTYSARLTLRAERMSQSSVISTPSSISSAAKKKLGRNCTTCGMESIRKKHLLYLGTVELKTPRRQQDVQLRCQIFLYLPSPMTAPPAAGECNTYRVSYWAPNAALIQRVSQGRCTTLASTFYQHSINILELILHKK